MSTRSTRALVAVGLTVAALVWARRPGSLAQAVLYAVRMRARPTATLTGRVMEVGPRARVRWAPFFQRAGVGYPPAAVTLLAVKDTAEMTVFARGERGAWRVVRRMPIRALSGGPGPKLREGDGQVPEGVYAIRGLNPNSRYHLALHVDYPSREDEARAQEDGRTGLGGFIMVHGGAASVGCLAMGDEGAEDLFVLAADVGVAGVRLVSVPTDFRVHSAWQAPAWAPRWMESRYTALRAELAALPR